MDRNWENLIVLDACRFDAFYYYSARARMPGKCSKMISAGSSTVEWLQNNFLEVKAKDIIYISANPYASNFMLNKLLGQIPFYRVIDVWKEGWSNELNTVHPSEVNTAALRSLETFPSFRHIIHYLQPHHPFIGNVRIPERGLKSADFLSPQVGSRKELNVWDKFRKGLISVDMIWKAYLSNLELVMDYVRDLLPHLHGKICITSDHGNAFGRFNTFYQHPIRTPLPELIEVPWLEIEKC